MMFKAWLNLHEVADLPEAQKLSLVDMVAVYLRSHTLGKGPETLLANTVHSLITKDHGIDKKTLYTDPNFQQQRNTYRQTLAAADQYAMKYGWFHADHKMGDPNQYLQGADWHQWYRGDKKKGKKQDGKTFKRYITVPPNDMIKAVSAFPNLLRHLTQVQASSPEQDMIGVKILGDLLSQTSERDNIVIHFYDPNMKQGIEAAIQQWYRDSGVQNIDRTQFQRPNWGVDQEQGADRNSDSIMVGKQFIRTVMANQQYIQQQINQAATNPTVKKQLADQLTHILGQIAANASHRQGF